MSTRFAQVTRLTAAALAAAAVLAACSPGDGIVVQSTPGTATASPELLPPETKPSNDEPQKYQDVTDKGERFNQAKNPAQWASKPLPGSQLIPYPPLATTRGIACTLGPAVIGSGGNGWLTAGHCDRDRDTLQSGYFTDDAGVSATYLGDLSDIKDTVEPYNLDGASDRAAVWTGNTPFDPRAAHLAGFPIAGVMREAAVRDLPAGTPICISGARSGVVCSAKIDTDGPLIEYPDVARVGDSGAPVFLVDSGGSALLIGLLSGGSDGVGTATYLEPVLRELRAQVISEPGAQAVNPELLDPTLSHSR